MKFLLLAIPVLAVVLAVAVRRDVERGIEYYINLYRLDDPEQSGK